MANEIKMSLSCGATISGVTITRMPVTQQMDWTGGRYISHTQVVGSTYEALVSSSDLGNPGIIWVKNCSAVTAYVSFDGGTTNHLAIKANETQTFRLAATLDPTSVMVKAASGSVVLDYTLMSD